MGGTELIIALVIILLLFGAKRIPELARGLGSGVREFRAGTREGQLEDKTEEEKRDEERKKDEEDLTSTEANSTKANSTEAKSDDAEDTQAQRDAATEEADSARQKQR